MPNALAHATSPYLLQHADNPVQWFEWGPAAFERARRESKPIFLSIGYSTCHWCHVMAHESFENPDVARVLNEFFVSIKVDREERPDIDRLYMAFVQATTGSGGWPMSVWLTPDAAPFFGGTYFPPTDRYGRPGFVTVLERIAELWAQEPQNLVEQANNAIAALRETSAPTPGPLVASALTAGLDAFARNYDAARGGFGSGPKFPRPAVFAFLLRRPETTARDITLHTLRAMAAGGLRDHLGGGFHRYSVDGDWHVPHFEKMLYDQAQLVCATVDAWKLTADPAFADLARETLAYVARDLAHPAGGFFSAEDADSLLEHGKSAHAEGAFYVWDHAEITALLGDRSDAFNRRYGVLPGGNVDPAADPHGEFPGKNILILREPADLTGDAFAADRAALFAARALRPRPHLDDKILTAWNGLMISAFARAGAAFTDPALIATARRAAEFLRAELTTPEGDLLRTWRDGRAAIPAFAEDHACLIAGLLDLYEATFERPWLDWALDLQTRLDARFFDGTSYPGSTDADPLVPLRLRDDYDGAEPAASSVAAQNLLRLAAMTHDDALRERARTVVESFATILARMPSAVPQMLCALDQLLAPPAQAVVAGTPGDPEFDALAARVRPEFAPNRVLLRAGDTAATADMTPLNGRATLYVCENFTCQAPITA